MVVADEDFWRPTLITPGVLLWALVLHHRSSRRHNGRDTMHARDIMTQPPATCGLGTSLSLASLRMAESTCGALMVTNHGGRVVGILTDRDLALAIGKSDRNPSQIQVDEAMTRDVYTCLPDEELPVVLERMADVKVRRLPVVAADGVPVGILSIDDIILWGVKHRGVRRKTLVKALRAICSAHEPLLQTETIDVL
jgi:CBS domain-containing protein